MDNKQKDFAYKWLRICRQLEALTLTVNAGSLEDLVSTFDEKLTMCFQDFQEQVDKIAPVQVNTVLIKHSGNTGSNLRGLNNSCKNNLLGLGKESRRKKINNYKEAKFSWNLNVLYDCKGVETAPDT